MRHAAHGWLEFSVLGIPAEGRPGTRSADRYRREVGKRPLPDGGQSCRRQRGDIARFSSTTGTQTRSAMAEEDRGRRRRVVESSGGARDERSEAD